MDELHPERPFRLTEIYASAAEQLKELESTLRRRIAEHFVWFFNRTDNQAQLLALIEEQAHGWVVRAEEIYRNCLRGVGREESPAIIAVIWDKGLRFFITGTVRELILESCGINEDLRMTAEIALQLRCRLPDTMALLRRINEVNQVVKKIHDEWQIRLSPPVPIVQTLDNLGMETEKNQVGKISAGKPRPKSLKYTSPTKRAILVALTKVPSSSDLDVWRSIDADGSAELPKSWATDKNDRSFELAYKSRATRTRMEKMTTKVRADMRRNGTM
jgi:hypothetical protein